ncbi:MAG: demethoxyubiquinone hydroxylase family protein [Woeseiaceae bacterium]|nr:demethoxyubiquinone hydroxylase family protein [Woeseiaceae bacterium]
MTNTLKQFENTPLPSELVADLRSDHAGETGAVAIYGGILAVSRDPEVRRFAEAHRETERVHLAFFEEWMPGSTHSRLLPVWRAAGWSLGAFSALFGRNSVYRTIAAVETFVEKHYEEQIDKMEGNPEFAALTDKLKAFCAEEVEHRDDAAGRLSPPSGVAARFWSRIVGTGSSVGVALARRI